MYLKHLCINTNSNSNPSYLDEGDGLGAAVRHDERVLDIPRDGEDKDDEELDHAHGEELVHLLLAVQREDRVSERAAPLLQEGRGGEGRGEELRGGGVGGYKGMANNASPPALKLASHPQ